MRVNSFIFREKAYGACQVLEPNFAPDPDGKSDYGNPYLFTGRRWDILDSGSLKIQYNRNRYYDYHTGRWLTQDPLGITPNPPKPNSFDIIGQYKDGMNLYEAFASTPVMRVDRYGLLAPPASKPFECGCCGPDITTNLDELRYRVGWRFRSSERKKQLCRTWWGWDILSLTGGMQFPDATCSSYDCAGTVLVHGKCYSQWAVNYYLWGLINRLCDSEARMYVGLGWPLFGSGDFLCKKSWAEAGYSGTTTGINCPKYNLCYKICKYNVPYLSYTWH